MNATKNDFELTTDPDDLLVGLTHLDTAKQLLQRVESNLRSASAVLGARGHDQDLIPPFTWLSWKVNELEKAAQAALPDAEDDDAPTTRPATLDGIAEMLSSMKATIAEVREGADLAPFLDKLSALDDALAGLETNIPRLRQDTAELRRQVEERAAANPQERSA